MNLLDLSIASLEAQAENDNSHLQNTALMLLSVPEVLEEVFDENDVEAKAFGICTAVFCNEMGTVYQLNDSDKVWCRAHVRRHIGSAVSAKLRALADVTGNTYYQDAVDNIDAWRGTYEMITASDQWPTIEPVATCFVCNNGIVEDLVTGSYAPVEATLADGTTAIVHAGCTTTCTSCDTQFASRRWYQDRSAQMMHMHMIFSGNRDIRQGYVCDPCYDIYENDDTYEHYDCDNCSNRTVGLAGDELEIYSELRDMYVCRSCYDAGVDCDDCGGTMYEDDYHNCDSDDDDYEDSIHGYNYKPYPIFHGESGPYMGFELEVECRNGSRTDGVDIMNNLDPNEKRWYLKHDGSLNFGFEVVTHPHNLAEYHKLDWSWLDKLNEAGFRSWNTSSCGLHVHIGVQDFKDENHQIRFTKFIYDNERQVKRIAGRTSSYAAFDSKGKVIPKIKYKHRDPNRYSAVNVQNEQTLEVRVFRGSLRKERVLSAIEFTHAVCEYTRDMKVVPKSKPFSWLRFSAYVAANDEKYPNLFTIINETFERQREIDNQEDGDND